MSAQRAVLSPPVSLSEAGPAIEGRREFRIVGEGERYILRLLDVPIEFELDRTRRDHGDLIGQLAVRTELSGARTYQGTLSIGSFNCSSPTARASRAKQLLELSRAPQIDWLRLLEEFAIQVTNAERAGGPAVDLRTFPRPTTADVINIDGIQILDKHPMIGFGDGGGGKSLLALYIGGKLALQGLRVGYADWELSGEDHRDRLERLFGPGMPEVFYIRCSRPMTAEADRITRLVREHDLHYLICDSISFACDGRPEDAEVAARYFQCLRQIGVGSFSVAHINKTDDSDKKPFGSSFWFNGARSIWNIKRSETSSDGREITVGLYHRKANLGPLLPSVGFRLGFEAERTHVTPVDLATVDDLSAGLPLKERMKEPLRRGPLTLAALADELSAKADTLEKTVRRHPNLFIRVPGSDGVSRISLVERNRS